MTNVTRMLRPLHDFLRAETGAGLLLLVMIPIALVWANGPFARIYETVWSTELGLRLGDHELMLDLRHWVNDFLMALFFFVVGLEIKRELIDGELRDRSKALTPVMAAFGGMALPALIYAGMNLGSDGVSGWGVPMATDIAIVLGFLALLGNRVPTALKTFILTLAIVDDIGAILVIAMFYSGDGISLSSLVLSLACVGLFGVISRWGKRPAAVLVVLAFLAWYAMHESGLHATLVGVALALATPTRPHRDATYVDAEMLADISGYEQASQTVDGARQSVSSVEWFQHLFHPWSSYLVLPLFALANAGIVISYDSASDALGSSVSLGVFFGLLVGKPVGICLFVMFAVHAFRAKLPDGISMGHVACGSLLAGIGFTVSLFIADLAFDNTQLTNDAKVGVLTASFVASVVGCAVLRIYLGKRPQLPPIDRKSHLWRQSQE